MTDTFGHDGPRRSDPGPTLQLDPVSARRWFGMPDIDDPVWNRLVDAAAEALRSAAPVSEDLLDSLTGAFAARSAATDRCYRDCPPKSPAPVRTEMHASGVYMICTHDPRHAVKIGP